jgi:hypothetical protein
MPSSVLRGTPKSQGTTHSVTRGHKSMFEDKHSNKDASVKEERHSSHKASPIKEDHSPKSHHSSKSIPKRESSRPQSSAKPPKEHTLRSPPSSKKVDTSKYRKVSSKEGGDPPSPSQSSSSSHTSSSSYRTSTSYAPSIAPTQSSYHSTSSTSTRHSRKSHRPDKFVQVMETVHELAQAIAQQGSKESSPPIEKFKMNNYFQLKHMRISKGERITTPFILKTLSTVKSIESAASKASNRKPQTTNEWDTYLKFHLSHLEDSLHEEMSSYCQEHEFHDSSSFWTQVYKKVFPAEVALDAFDKALTTYMIWTEPLGFERWEYITSTLLTHRAFMKGRTPEEVPMNLVEGLAQQLQRVVRACPEQQSAALFKDYTNVYSEILTARELCHPITKEMYTKANATFISQLKRLLNSYTSESIFGHSTVKDHKAADPNPSLPKVQQLTKENPKPAPATPSAPSKLPQPA